MTFHPWRRQEPLDHTELARLLPAPGDPVLPHDLQLTLEANLMNAMLDESSRPARRRSPGVRIVLPAGLAAAAAAAVFALGHSGAPVTAAGTAPSQSAATAGGAGSPLKISTVSYSIEKSPTGTVKLIADNFSSPAIDVKGLRADLARMGIPARIYVGDRACKEGYPPHPTTQEQAHRDQATQDAAMTLTTDREHGFMIWTIDPAKIPADRTLALYYPHGTTGSGRLGVVTLLLPGDGPSCAPYYPAPGDPAPASTGRG
jgi:hypothetical protein